MGSCSFRRAARRGAGLLGPAGDNSLRCHQCQACRSWAWVRRFSQPGQEAAKPGASEYQNPHGRKEPPGMPCHPLLPPSPSPTPSAGRFAGDGRASDSKERTRSPGKYPITTIGVCTDGLAGARVERLSSHRRSDASPLVMAALRNSDVGRDCGRTPGPSSRRGCSLGFVAWRSDACRGCPASVVVSVPSPTLAASSERALRSGTRGVGF